MTVLRAGAGEIKVSPTTTDKLAARMLAAARVIDTHLPNGMQTSPGWNILLELYVDEEVAHYPNADSLKAVARCSPELIRRWIAMLQGAGLVDLQSGLLALTAAGHATVLRLLTAVYEAQRLLD